MRNFMRQREPLPLAGVRFIDHNDRHIDSARAFHVGLRPGNTLRQVKCNHLDTPFLKKLRHSGNRINPEFPQLSHGLRSSLGVIHHPDIDMRAMRRCPSMILPRQQFLDHEVALNMVEHHRLDRPLFLARRRGRLSEVDA